MKIRVAELTVNLEDIVSTQFIAEGSGVVTLNLAGEFVSELCGARLFGPS
jgi:hypothetical protein